MGYPVKNALVISLIESIGLLYSNAGKNKENQITRYYYKNVLSILNHPYIAQESKDAINQLKIDIINKNRIFILPSELPENDLINLIFQPPLNSLDFLTRLSSLIKTVGRKSFGNRLSIETQPEGIEAETLVLVYSNINRFSDLILSSNMEFDIHLCFRLLMKVLNNLTLPFEGEPLKGLQIMGLLESRAIDFDNVILLNVNEGHLPKTNIPASFIPYNLRHGFGLPTLEYRDAIYAYYFYRIIQRAKNVYLLYNTKSDKMGCAEISRYATQMLYSDKYKITKRFQTFNIVPASIPEISIIKTPEIMKVLEKYYENSKSEYYISPSALSSYIDCKLRFYFRYVAGLKEFEIPTEEIDASMLGNILHNAMYSIYKPFINKTIQKENLENILISTGIIEKAIHSSIAKVYFKDIKALEKESLQGRNFIISKILDKYIRQIIETDIQNAPFNLAGLEHNVISNFDVDIKSGITKIKIGGNIDRIDKIDSTFRIIDYKTGNVENKFKNYEELFEPEEGRKAKKEILQACLYAMLYKNINNIQTACYSLHLQPQENLWR